MPASLRRRAGSGAAEHQLNILSTLCTTTVSGRYYGGMRMLVAVREIRAGQLIVIEGRDHPFIVASVQRLDGLTSITAYDPDSVERDAFGVDQPTESVTMVLDEHDLAAVLV